MKKLMIAAAIVCAAVVSQAATVSWTISGLKDSKGNDLSGYAYTFTNKGDSSVTRDTIVSALESSTSVETFQAAIAKYVSGVSGAVSDGELNLNGLSVTQSGLKENTSGTKLFAVLIDTDTLTADSNWYVTEYSNTAKVLTDAAQGGTSFTLDDDGASGVTGAWTPVQSVPEPTSAMLLLLGVAGLALRRRRA